jgi:hypothetical protein
MPPKDVDKIKSDISEIRETLVRIETLLIGEDGSGLCGQVKELKEIKLDKSIYENSQKKIRWNIGTLIGISGVISAIVIAIIK